MGYHSNFEANLAERAPVLFQPKHDDTSAFTPLEWRIIKDAREDGAWTLRPMTKLNGFFNWLVNRTAPKLANLRLETLRRVALLSWRDSYKIPRFEFAEFLGVGYTMEQYQLLIQGIHDLKLQLKNAA